MNLTLLPSAFNIENINLLRKKENTVVDGNFSKFTYANELFIMNGMYLLFPVNKLLYTQDAKFIYNTYQLFFICPDERIPHGCDGCKSEQTNAAGRHEL